MMSGPAMRALKDSFGARITLLTSHAGSGIVPFMSEIDEVIVADLPWVKTDALFSPAMYIDLVAKLESLEIDLAVIFTVYSQSALPAALLCWQAGIPGRLAYCRENPYHLLTTWVPDEEPYSFIRHQVERDLHLVRQIGADTDDDRLRVNINIAARRQLKQRLGQLKIDPDERWIVLHPGVSEAKREYPHEGWIEIASTIYRETGMPLLITGARKDRPGAARLHLATTARAYNLAGLLDMEEFAALLAGSSLVITVNTVTAHLAAAMGTPEIVLYALTNPQHTPWRARGEILPFSVDPALRSRNAVVRWVGDRMETQIPPPSPELVIEAARRLLSHPGGADASARGDATAHAIE